MSPSKTTVEYRACADDGDLPYSNEDTSPEYGEWLRDEDEALAQADEFDGAVPRYSRIWIERREITVAPPGVHRYLRNNR